ncbi:PepSY domain-containing protein [Consotaella aegiceratis]|uniref:PepSY domain-containing protein n=1 Tax=Consotaella aegiceratis TaxID=3097961 RepID=UPI002F40EA5A
MKLALAIALNLMMVTAGLAASNPDDDPKAQLPPQSSIKLSQLIEKAEQRPGFYAIKSISYSDGQYEVIYYMDDGAEVHLNYNAATGQIEPPKSGGLFGG